MTAEKLKYRAKINAKGLDTTGVTEEHARSMAANLGSHHLFVVEGRAVTVVTDEEGNQQVAVVLTQVELVPRAQEDVVREFIRALYRSRPEQRGQEALTGVLEGPTVTEAAAALSAQVERDEDGEPAGVWDGNPDAPLTAPEPDEAEKGGHVVNFSAPAKGKRG